MPAAKPLDIKYSYIQVPTVLAFHKDDSFIRGLMGPFGSGKSVGCIMEILRRANLQKPGPDKIKRSRWAIIRNTYRQLQDTTIKTVTDWLPPARLGRFLKSDSTYIIDKIPGVHLELLFRALDRPDQIGNLLSAEYTGAWVNEAREVPFEIIEGLQGRVGRYPSARAGGATWHGIIMDTNPPDDDSWWYQLFEETRPENARIFKQPSGLSPEAENTANLPANYYANLAEGKDSAWVDVYINGRYGRIKDGRPVYPEWAESCITDTCLPIPDVGISLGWDFGLTPACAICQITPMGELRVLEELVVEDHGGMGIRQFSQEVVKPHLISKYKEWIDKRIVTSYGDPAGNQRAQTDEMTCLMVLNGDHRDQRDESSLGALGVYTSPARTNSAIARIDAVKYFLNHHRLSVHPSCRCLIKGFRGAYQYQRVQVSGDARYQDAPSKNRYSHIADALQYAALMALPEQWQRPVRLSSADKRLHHLIHGDQDSYEAYAAATHAEAMRGFGIDSTVVDEADMDEYADYGMVETMR